MSENQYRGRHEARELAFKLLYAKEFSPDADASEFYDSYMDDEECAGTDPSGYAKVCFTSVSGLLAGIDAEIDNMSVGWKVTRMSPVTKSILRLAVYEMQTAVPVKVVINEAVELAKEYDDGPAPKFINGILHNLAGSYGLLEEK